MWPPHRAPITTGADGGRVDDTTTSSTHCSGSSSLFPNPAGVGCRVGPLLTIADNLIALPTLRVDASFSPATAPMGWPRLPSPVRGPKGPRTGPWRLSPRAGGGGGASGSSAGGHVGRPLGADPHGDGRAPPPPAATEHPSTWDPNGGRAILAWAPGGCSQATEEEAPSLARDGACAWAGAVRVLKTLTAPIL